MHFAHRRDLVAEVGEGADVLEVRVAAPEVEQELAAGDGAGGVFEAAGVAGGAVVDAERGGRLEPDDRVVAGEFRRVVGAQVAPVVVGAVGPVGGAVDRAAVEQERLAGWSRAKRSSCSRWRR